MESALKGLSVFHCDSFSASVFGHWHSLSLLLSKVLFSCWEDICLTARHTCHFMEWTNLNLCQSLSPNIVLNDNNICWSKDTLQSICLLSKVHLMWPFLCRVDVLPHAAVPESSVFVRRPLLIFIHFPSLQGSICWFSFPGRDVM